MNPYGNMNSVTDNDVSELDRGNTNRSEGSSHTCQVKLVFKICDGYPIFFALLGPSALRVGFCHCARPSLTVVAMHPCSNPRSGVVPVVSTSQSEINV
eukprot:COSAG02_NODE_4936_length_4813_cov_1.661222_3_plen_98_part_00